MKTGPKPAAKRAATKGQRAKRVEAAPPGEGHASRWLLGGAALLFVVAGAVVLAQRGAPPEAQPPETVTPTVEGAPSPGAAVVPEAYRVRVVARHPHASDAFTQGLLWHDGALYESTGLEGRSSLRRVDLTTGEVLERTDVPEAYFAEGLARVGDRLIQLTWQNERAFVYDLRTFEKVAEHSYEGEGWGLCFDGTHLVMSDGSDRLSLRDPRTFEVVRTVRVTKIGRPVRYLNELECVDGKVWANIWQRDEIVGIDPSTGVVTDTVDASGLLSREERRGTDVLNGIAWLPDRGHFLLTGKLWPWAFEVELVRR